MISYSFDLLSYLKIVFTIFIYWWPELFANEFVIQVTNMTLSFISIFENMIKSIIP